MYRTLSDEEYRSLEEQILYEDNHILVINKHVGQIVQGDKTGDEPLGETFKAFIAARDNKPGQVFMGIPHRLDRPVCGITILAKTSKALERLSVMFRDGEVSKTYWALLCAHPAEEEDYLEDYLVRNEKMNKSFISKRGDKTPGAKLARLKYKVIGNTERYTLVEINLFTGRHHQIRCQMAGIGCPIKGDLKYGAPRSNRNGGISLMARHISFIHPVRKTPVEITAPIPADWKGVHEL